MGFQRSYYKILATRLIQVFDKYFQHELFKIILYDNLKNSNKSRVALAKHSSRTVFEEIIKLTDHNFPNNFENWFLKSERVL